MDIESKTIEMQIEYRREHEALMMPIHLQVWGQERTHNLLVQTTQEAWGNDRKIFRQLTTITGNRLTLGEN